MGICRKKVYGISSGTKVVLSDKMLHYITTCRMHGNKINRSKK